MLVTMSDKELIRINIILSVVEKRMRRRCADQQHALTERQTQHLSVQYIVMICTMRNINYTHLLRNYSSQGNYFSAMIYMLKLSNHPEFYTNIIHITNN